MSGLDPWLAIVPARGGSKGLPGKNIRPLLGLPLLARADRARTAAMCRSCAAPELARDDTPMMPALTRAPLSRRANSDATSQRFFRFDGLLDPHLENRR